MGAAIIRTAVVTRCRRRSRNTFDSSTIELKHRAETACFNEKKRKGQSTCTEMVSRTCDAYFVAFFDGLCASRANYDFFVCVEGCYAFCWRIVVDIYR